MPLRRVSRSGFWLPVFVLCAASVVLLACTANAGSCGDDVNGRRIACGCGDVVVSSTSLLAGDPVLTAPCSGDGLILRAEPGAPSLRLNLNGQTLIGQGQGVGIRVLYAGEGGAVILGGDAGTTAVIANFGTGIRGADPQVVRELRGVRLSGNTRDGLTLRAADALVSEVSADRNGRDGVRVSGRAPRLGRIEAEGNGRYGVVTPSHDEAAGVRR